uniref:Ig-like domain-containing protein n=1 Tax=Sarcophilus harrisii TaxID=9305 RepID=G3VJ20_SARHA
MSARTLPTLARIYLLGVLLSILPGSEAQMLVEKGGKVTHEGQSVTLICQSVTSSFNFREYAISWHWSPTESHRELVASISPKTGSDKTYSSRIQGRAFISRNNMEKTVSLTLNRLQKEDSGTYYCAR